MLMLCCVSHSGVQKGVQKGASNICTPVECLYYLSKSINPAESRSGGLAGEEELTQAPKWKVDCHLTALQMPRTTLLRPSPLTRSRLGSRGIPYKEQLCVISTLRRSTVPLISNIHRPRTYLTSSLRAHQARKMAPQLDGFFKQVDDLSGHFIDRLGQAVAIPSVSSDAARRPDVVRMAHFLEKELKTLGAEVELRPLCKQLD